MHMRDRIARRVTAIRHSRIERSPGLIRLIQARISDRKTETRSATEFLGLFVKSNRLIEPAHLAI